MIISDHEIHWIVSDKHPALPCIALVNIKHAEFSIAIRLTFYGRGSLENCTFNSLMMYVIQKPV